MKHLTWTWIIIALLWGQGVHGQGWTKTYYGIENWGGVQQTTDGGYIVAGKGYGGLSLLKTSNNGDSLWHKDTYLGYDEEVFYDVKQTTDGGYIATGRLDQYSNNKFFSCLVKTNATGDTIWTKSYKFGGLDNSMNSVEQTTDGGFITAGRIYDLAANGGTNGYIIKTDSNGDTIWTKSYNRSGSFIDVFLDIEQTSDGGYLAAGTAFDSTSSKTHVIKLNSTGQLQWAKSYDAGDGYGVGIIQSTNGDYLFYGHNAAIKTDVNGDTLWTRTINQLTPSVPPNSTAFFHNNPPFTGTNNKDYITEILPAEVW
ncbi:MAG: hypothetical protein GY810_18565 [Aureispira sp.]|nr:hypothetical protein [Aureispira sp.]